MRTKPCCVAASLTNLSNVLCVVLTGDTVPPRVHFRHTFVWLLEKVCPLGHTFSIPSYCLQKATRRRKLLYEPTHAWRLFHAIAIAGLNFLEIVETMIHTAASNFIAAFVFVVFYNFIYFYFFVVVGARRTAVGRRLLRRRWAARQCRGPVPTRTSHRGRPGLVRGACELASRGPRRGGGQGR